jgi:hypothetical protein
LTFRVCRSRLAGTTFFSFSMPNRREFLQAGIGVSLLPLLSSKALSAAAPRAFDLFVFDQRFPQARAFAQQAREAGVDCAAIEGDITHLYFHDLSLRWNRGPTTIAGLSTKASLFCLEKLACDRGMRLVHLADVVESEPVPDIAFNVTDRKRTAMCIVGEERERLVAWVIAPRETCVRGEGEI